MDDKPAEPNAAPAEADAKAAREPETFENPEFHPDATVPVVAPAKSAENLPARTLEVAPVEIPAEALPSAEPPLAITTREPAPTVRAPKGPLPPEARPPAPAASSSGLARSVPVALVAFSLGVLLTWLAMRPHPPTVVPEAAPAVAAMAPLPLPQAVDAEVAVPPAAPHAAVATKRPRRVDAPAGFTAAAPPTGMGVLRTYETGNLDEAIRVAQTDHASALLDKLLALRTALAHADAAAHNKDAAGEAAQLQTAAALDLSIDADSGPLRARIRTRLTSLHVDAPKHAAAPAH